MISLIIVSPTDTPLERLCLDKLYSVFFPHHPSRKKLGTTRDQPVRPVKNPRGLLNGFLARSFLITYSSFPSVINRGSKCSCVIFEKLFEVFRS